MTDQEPHEAYMKAVADALTDAGLRPDRWHAEDNGGDRLDGVFVWDKHNPLTPLDLYPRGVDITWDQYNGWEYSPVNAQGMLGDFRELVDAMYAEPASVVTAARLLLERNHQQLPVRSTAEWPGANAMAHAITAWEDALPE